MRNLDSNGKPDRSYLTAIGRKKVSLPCSILREMGLIKGKVLDYGCGRGYDALFYGWDKYDHHFFPERPRLRSKWDTIICSFVLNVQPEGDEAKILKDIRSLLKSRGVAYITVRRDRFKEGYTGKGTFQRMVKLDLPIVFENKSFCIYRSGK